MQKKRGRRGKNAGGNKGKRREQREKEGAEGKEGGFLSRKGEFWARSRPSRSTLAPYCFLRLSFSNSPFQNSTCPFLLLSGLKEGLSLSSARSSLPGSPSFQHRLPRPRSSSDSLLQQVGLWHQISPGSGPLTSYSQRQDFLPWNHPRLLVGAAFYYTYPRSAVGLPERCVRPSSPPTHKPKYPSVRVVSDSCRISRQHGFPPQDRTGPRY